MIKTLTLWLFFLMGMSHVHAQTTGAGVPNPDTNIYHSVEFPPMPLVKGCPYDWNLDSSRACAEQKFMALLAQNIVYPPEAQRSNLQGRVVVQFVVELDGQISNLKIIKDIGGGCGAEAIRVLRVFNQVGARWLPGKQGGKIVRTQVTLPISFRLEEALPYYLNDDNDTIYTQVNTPVAFRGGIDSLANYIFRHTQYPKAERGSCKVGVIEMSIIVFPNGKVKVDNMLDFNQLGDDFQFNAIRMAHRSAGLWIPATYDNRAVAATFPLRAVFKSDAPQCATTNNNFDQAMLIADQAMQIADADASKSIDQLNAALNLHPNNTELLFYRANLYISQNNKEAACADFSQIKSLLGITWFENYGKTVCGW